MKMEIMKHPAFKTGIAALFVLLCTSVAAQETVTKYFDKYWTETTQDKSTYYAVFEKDGDLYNCTSYYKNTQNVRGRSVLRDTSFSHPVGLITRYYKNGRLEDSIYISDDNLLFSYHYYPDKSLRARFVKGTGNAPDVIEGFDESGKKIKNFIFSREAEFKGGKSAWDKYIAKKAALSKKVLSELVAEGIEERDVSVIVAFIIDQDGSVTNARIEKSSGYRTIDDHTIGVIESSPKWTNAVTLNEAVKAYMMQPFRFQLQ